MSIASHDCIRTLLVDRPCTLGVVSAWAITQQIEPPTLWAALHTMHLYTILSLPLPPTPTRKKKPGRKPTYVIPTSTVSLDTATKQSSLTLQMSMIPVSPRF